MSKIKLTLPLIILGTGCFLWKYSGGFTAADADPALTPQTLSASNEAPSLEVKPTSVSYAFLVQFTPFAAFVTGPMTVNACVASFDSDEPVRCEDTLKEAQRAVSAEFPRLYQIDFADLRGNGLIWGYEEIDKPESPGLYFVTIEYENDVRPMKIIVSQTLTETQCIARLDASHHPVGFKEVVCLALNNVNDLLGERGCVQQPADFFLCTNKDDGMPDF